MFVGRTDGERKPDRGRSTPIHASLPLAQITLIPSATFYVNVCFEYIQAAVKDVETKIIRSFVPCSDQSALSRPLSDEITESINESAVRKTPVCGKKPDQQDVLLVSALKPDGSESIHWPVSVSVRSLLVL